MSRCSLPSAALRTFSRNLHSYQVQAVQQALVPPTSTVPSPAPLSERTLDRFRAILHATPPACVPRRLLVTGGMGQLGRSLVSILSEMLGPERVLLSDICALPDDFARHHPTQPYRYLDILDRASIERIVVEEHIDTVVHLSALLSALGEQQVERALEVNCRGVQNVLHVAKQHRLKLFVPSTIGVFGALTPRSLTPDIAVQRPATVYGVSKVFAELLGEYFCARHGVDFRSLRLPGIISTAQPGGGTTDYAIQMFWDALRHGRHICYLRPDSQLPMLFEEDCMAALVGILVAPPGCLQLRTYNVAGFSCTPAQLGSAIRRHMPNFQIQYDICPIRQQIADSWPQSLDDGGARADWGWRPEYSLERTVAEMLTRLGEQCPGQMTTTKMAQVVDDVHQKCLRENGHKVAMTSEVAAAGASMR